MPPKGIKNVQNVPPKRKKSIQSAPLKKSMQSASLYNTESHQFLYSEEILTQKSKED